MARTSLSIATFNLRNLQLPGVDMYRTGDAWEVQEYAAKVNWSVDRVHELDADLIGFQELWDPQALTDVFEAAGLADQYELLAPAPARRIGNALAVRRPHEVLDIEWITDVPARLGLRASGEATADGPYFESAGGTDYALDVDVEAFSRPVLHARVKLHQSRRRPRVDVYVAHLKSKRPTLLDKDLRERLSGPDETALGSALSTIRRVTEAAALRLVLNDAMDGERPTIVLGDLNDAQLSNATAILTGEPGLRLFAASRTGFKSTRGLYAAATLQELRSLRDVYYTHIWRGIRESLDHILVSQHFYDFADARLWSFRSMRCLNDHLELEEELVAVSDHAPVVATFDLNPA